MDKEESDALTKKHYIPIAEILGANCVDPESRLVTDLSRYFAFDNPRFNKKTFKKAIKEATPEQCELEE